jgi:hypothetical protein
MAIRIPRGKSDAILERFIDVLRGFEADHPAAQIDIYRQNPVSVRVRIIDPNFRDESKVERSKKVWRYLGKLPEEVQSDLSTLILLEPAEAAQSFANHEFEDPIPSSL